MDGPKVNAGGKLAGSPTTTLRSESVCLQVKSPKFSKTSAEPYISPGMYNVYYACYLQRRSVILLKSCLLDGLFLPGRLHCSNSCAGTEH